MGQQARKRETTPGGPAVRPTRAACGLGSRSRVTAARRPHGLALALFLRLGPHDSTPVLFLHLGA